MKRVALITTLIAAASVCAVAFGATTPTTRYYTGKDHDKGCKKDPDFCRVYFDGVVKNGRVSAIQYVEINGIPVKCDDGSHFDYGIGGPVYTVKAPIHVNGKRKFNGKFTASLDISPKAWFRLSGTFSKGYKDATGKLKMTFIRDIHNNRTRYCRSQFDKFSVHKTANPPPFHP